MRKLIFTFLITILFLPATALADNSVSVSATVPQMRVAYVDSGNRVTKLSTNTDINIDPIYINSSNQEIPSTPELANSYSAFINNIDSIKAGNTYNSPTLWQKIVKSFPSVMSIIF